MVTIKKKAPAPPAALEEDSPQFTLTLPYIVKLICEQAIQEKGSKDARINDSNGLRQLETFIKSGEFGDIGVSRMVFAGLLGPYRHDRNGVPSPQKPTESPQAATFNAIKIILDTWEVYLPGTNERIQFNSPGEVSDLHYKTFYLFKPPVNPLRDRARQLVEEADDETLSEVVELLEKHLLGVDTVGDRLSLLYKKDVLPEKAIAYLYGLAGKFGVNKLKDIASHLKIKADVINAIEKGNLPDQDGFESFIRSCAKQEKSTTEDVMDKLGVPDSDGGTLTVHKLIEKMLDDSGNPGDYEYFFDACDFSACTESVMTETEEAVLNKTQIPIGGISVVLHGLQSMGLNCTIQEIIGLNV